jgi:hypothetical protein
MGENNFIVEPIGGLSNRLRVIMAAKTLCEELGLNLKINWLYDSRFCHEMRKSEICGTHFLEVFEPLQTVKNTEISFVSTPELPTVKNGENFYRGTDVGFARIRVSEFYKKLTAQYKFLKPRAYLREQIDLLTKRHSPYRSLHIRRGDHLRYLKKIKIEPDSLDKFESFIRAEPGGLFFLATDCKKTQLLLTSKYKGRLFTSASLDSSATRPTSLQEAVVDIFLCVNSQKFLGTKLSSFSGLIQMLRTINE